MVASEVRKNLVLQCGTEHMLKKKKKSEAQPHDLELQTLKCTRVPELLADPKFWPSKSSSFCDVEILVGLR